MYIGKRSRFKNFLETFQKAIKVILTTLRRYCALVYIVCIIIFSRASEENLQKDNVLDQQNNAEMKVTLTKWSLFIKAADYPDHVTVPGKLLVVNKATKVVKALQHPTTLSNVDADRFLDFVTFIDISLQVLQSDSRR